MDLVINKQVHLEKSMEVLQGISPVPSKLSFIYSSSHASNSVQTPSICHSEMQEFFQTKTPPVIMCISLHVHDFHNPDEVELSSLIINMRKTSNQHLQSVVCLYRVEAYPSLQF